MPDLSFAIEGVEAVPYAAVPQLSFKTKILNHDSAEVIRSVSARVQILIEPTLRKYTPAEQASLKDLFGEPDRWGRTLRSMLWTHAALAVPAFTGSAAAELCVPCTFDFNVPATKYFYALKNDDLPLCFQFSGSVFYQGEDEALQVAPISWDKEAKFRLPVKVWKELMDLYYPNSAWLSLRRDTFEKLYRFKVHEGIPTWEAALERALSALPEAVES